LGLIALWGLLFHKKEIKSFFRLLAMTQLNQRVRALQETLKQLEDVSFDNKGDRKEIFNLVGQVCGQLSTLVKLSPEMDLLEIRRRFMSIHEKQTSLNEPVKRQLIHELMGHLENLTLDESKRFLEGEK
jgi:hypothetical protein